MNLVALVTVVLLAAEAPPVAPLASFTLRRTFTPGSRLEVQARLRTVTHDGSVIRSESDGIMRIEAVAPTGIARVVEDVAEVRVGDGDDGPLAPQDLRLQGVRSHLGPRGEVYPGAEAPAKPSEDVSWATLLLGAVLLPEGPVRPGATWEVPVSAAPAPEGGSVAVRGPLACRFEGLEGTSAAARARFACTTGLTLTMGATVQQMEVRQVHVVDVGNAHLGEVRIDVTRRLRFDGRELGEEREETVMTTRPAPGPAPPATPATN